MITLSQPLENRYLTSARTLLLVALLYCFGELLENTRMTGTFGNMPFSLLYGHEQQHAALFSNQGLVSCVGLPLPYNGLDILCLTACRLRDCLTLTRPRLVLTSEWAGSE